MNAPTLSDRQRELALKISRELGLAIVEPEQLDAVVALIANFIQDLREDAVA